MGVYSHNKHAFAYFKRSGGWMKFEEWWQISWRRSHSCSHLGVPKNDLRVVLSVWRLIQRALCNAPARAMIHSPQGLSGQSHLKKEKGLRLFKLYTLMITVIFLYGFWLRAIIKAPWLCLMLFGPMEFLKFLVSNFGTQIANLSFLLPFKNANLYGWKTGGR